jgi:hypothetical protein
MKILRSFLFVLLHHLTKYGEAVQEIVVILHLGR